MVEVSCAFFAKFQTNLKSVRIPYLCESIKQKISGTTPAFSGKSDKKYFYDNPARDNQSSFLFPIDSMYMISFPTSRVPFLSSGIAISKLE
jgi:hypothetical protein